MSLVTEPIISSTKTKETAQQLTEQEDNDNNNNNLRLISVKSQRSTT